METRYTPIIKKLFWRISLPCLLVASLWCLVKGLSPLENIFFQIACMMTIPMMAIKVFEQESKTIDNLAEDFRKMGATEFLNFIEDFRAMPLGKLRALHKEAYTLVYRERYGKDIFGEIPSFGD